MRTLQRTVAVLIFPAIAYLGAGCERTDTPTAPTAVPPISAAAYATPTRWVNDDDPTPLNGYAPPGTSCNDPGYQTIGAAVAAAAVSGEIIQVCGGTYTENVVLNKSLTLLGEQVGVDARGRVASEAIVTPAVLINATLELRSGSVRSIIDGFTFLGGTFTGGSGHSGAIESTGGPIDSLQILNNRIRGFTAGSGVFLNDKGINITVNQNEIDGSSKLGGGGLVHLDQDNFDGFWFTSNRVVSGTTATGFFVDGNRNVDQGTMGARTPLFSGNFMDNNGTGANLGRLAWGDGPITGNTFSNNVFDGLQGGPKNSMITFNTFDKNGRNGLLLTGFGGTTDPARGAQGNTVTQNCFTANGVGISFSAIQFPGTISTNVAHQNNIFDNSIGAQYLGAETIDATSNWWGSPTGPFHVTNNPTGLGNPVVDDGNGITFIPFLTSPAGGTPCTPPPLPPSGKVTGGGQIDVMNGKGSFGFNAKLENGAASGHLNYLNHFTDVHLNCTVTNFTVLTTTEAQFNGTCSSKNYMGNFMAEVEDNGEPGKKNMDQFKITYGSPPATEGGTIRSGNIQIHK